MCRPRSSTRSTSTLENRTLPGLGQVAHSTERTLMRRTQRDLGMSVAEWRQHLRVVKAMPLLEAGHTLETIALDLGYGSASAFIKHVQTPGGHYARRVPQGCGRGLASGRPGIGQRKHRVGCAGPRLLLLGLGKHAFLHGSAFLHLEAFGLLFLGQALQRHRL
jgi:AraC-like DNA-binding protein